MFDDVKGKKSDDGADIHHSQGGNETTEKIKVRVGVEGDELHKTRVLQFGKPRAQDAHEQHDRINEKYFFDEINKHLIQNSLRKRLKGKL